MCTYAIKHWNSRNSDLTQVILERDSSLYNSYVSIRKTTCFYSIRRQNLIQKIIRILSYGWSGGGEGQNHPYVINE